MPKSKLVTVLDVAKAADVAVGTVSRVLNNVSNVNDESRARVLKAMHQLGYKRIRQNRKANEEIKLSRANGNIGVVLFGMEDTLVQLPVVGAALHGVESAVSALGQNLMLANIPRGDLIPAFMRDRGVVGLILKGPNQGALPRSADSELIRAIEGFPRVWLMGKAPNATGDHCNFDADAAGSLAGAFLHEQGHRRIAFFNPKPGHIQFEKIQRGLVDTGTRLDLEIGIMEVDPATDLSWPLPATTLADKVQILADRWVRVSRNHRPTALVVPSDRAAVQLYGAMERHGIRIGRDVSIISCNNEVSLISGLNPALTTVDVNADGVGRRAVEHLLWRVANPEEPLSFQVLVEPNLVVRHSVVRLP